MEKIIETFVVDGVEFTIIEKPATLYAGTYAIAPDVNSEPDFDSLMKDEEVFKLIRNSASPDRKIVLSIDRTSNERLGAILVGQETTSREQPKNIRVIEAEPSLYIKLKHSHAAFALTKKLTGKYVHQYHMGELLGLVRHVFCEGDGAVFEFNGCRQNGNEEMEIFNLDGEPNSGRYVAVPVRRKDGKADAPVTLNAANCKIGGAVELIAPRTLKDIEEAQAAPKDFEKINFSGRDWLVLEKRDGKALVVAEKTILSKRYHRGGNITWAECELRGFLNHEFYNTFNDAEKVRIELTQVTTPVQSWHGTDGGADTEDHIFLLSVQEIIKYFGDSGDFDKRIGFWLSMEGAWWGDGLGQGFSDAYNTARIARDADGKPTFWWTRSPGYEHWAAVPVGDNGALGAMTGWDVGAEIGVRPAMWLKLEPKQKGEK